MRRMLLACGLLAALGVACGPSVHPAVPATPASAVAPALSGPVRSVNAVVTMNGCSHLGPANAKLAEKAMSQLVDGCGRFAGPTVEFVARLLPGGAIEFVARPGQTQSIPICVLQHPLKHGVKQLSSACTLDVKLEGAPVTATP